jgi:5-methylcytosine-specific restriction enzyme subunit McrC
MKPKLVTIFEHDYIVRDSGELSDHDFDKLYSYVCNENQKAENNSSVDTWLLKPCSNNGKQALKATQYIGIIQFDDGVVLEILPKLFKTKQGSPQEQTPEKQARELVLKMLRTLKSANFKNIHCAGLDFAKMHLLDIFIWMFLDEVDSIVKQGIKHKYIEREDNLSFFKGKLLVNQNIAKNYGLMHKNYMQYDDYLPNIPENRLIKSALGYLLKTCKSSRLLQEIRKSYFIFDEVSNSLNVQQDYTQCNKNSRIFSHYQNALEWAMMFLAGKSFTSQVGSHSVKSLLFDMNKLFEGYVSHHVQNVSDYTDIYTQKHDHYLVYVSDEGSNNYGRMKLIPDLKFMHASKLIIADTKWKMIQKDNDLSQADFYQMFAYYSKYKDKDKEHNENVEIWLIYPKHDEINNRCDITQQYIFDNNKQADPQAKLDLQIKFFDFDSDALMEFN